MLSKDQRQEITRRLENWARWYYGSSSAASESPFPAYRMAIRGPRDYALGIPVLMGEGQDTDAILRKMPPRMVKVLLGLHIGRGTPRARAKRCKCSVAQFYREAAHAENIFHRLVYPVRRGIQTKSA